MIKKIEHIGIAVRNLQVSIPIFEKLLMSKCYKIEEINDQKVKVGFFKVGEVKIELLEPTSSDSPIAKFIEKKGEGIHHIAFLVNNINYTLNFFEKEGIELIDKTPKIGAENLLIAFLHPKSTNSVLIELCSEN